MNLQKQINDILTEKRISKYQLAKDTGINESQLSRFFNHKTNLSYANIELIVKYLDYEIKLIPINKK